MLKTLLLHLICPFFSLFAGAPAPVPGETPVSKAVETPAVQVEKTLSILKPDAIEDNVVGEILEYFETAGLQIVASKMTRLTDEQAKAFYAEHKDKAFFPELISYMTSGPVIVQVLEGEDAVAVNRRVMGATDPGKASPGTVRSDFGTNITRNAVHGSDSVTNAQREIGFFFQSDEIYSHN